MAVRFAVVLCLLAIVGCDDREAQGNPAMDASNPSSTPAAILRVVSEPNMALQFGERGTFAVRYTETDGETLPRATVHFALEGNAHDSTLNALEARTDDEGEASGYVLAGATDAVFHVRITAPRAAPVYIEVSVSDHGFGGLDLTVEYDGLRTRAERAVMLFANANCSSPRVAARRGDRMKKMGPTETEARFAQLPAGLSYAALAWIEAPSGAPLAEGCVDGLLVEADEDLAALVHMSDLPFHMRGTYDMELVLTARQALRRIATALTAASRESVDAVNGEPQLLLRGLEATLREAGEEEAAGSLAASIESGDAPDDLQSRLTQNETGPTAAIERIVEAVSLLQNIAMRGLVYAEDKSDPSRWVTTSVALLSSDEKEPLSIALRSPGAPFEGMLVVQYLPKPPLQIERLMLPMSLGWLGRGMLDAFALRSDDEAIDLWLENGGCQELDAFVRESASNIAEVCNEECVYGGCRNAYEGVLERVVTRMEQLDEQRSTIVLEGELDISDRPEDLVVDDVTGDSLMGRWESSEGGASDPVEASLEGTRL